MKKSKYKIYNSETKTLEGYCLESLGEAIVLEGGKKIDEKSGDTTQDLQDHETAATSYRFALENGRVFNYDFEIDGNGVLQYVYEEVQ